MPSALRVSADLRRDERRVMDHGAICPNPRYAIPKTVADATAPSRNLVGQALVKSRLFANLPLLIRIQSREANCLVINMPESKLNEQIGI